MKTTSPHEMLCTPEVRLLLLCAQPALDNDQAAQACRLIQAGVNWQLVVALAVRNRVQAFVYQNLKSHCPHVTPAEHLHQLRDIVQQNKLQCMSLTGALARLLALFSQQGIPVIAYKGPQLAQQIYGDVGLRAFGDLDLIFREQDIMRVSNVLRDNGFIRTWPEAEMTPSQQRLHLQTKYHDKYVAANSTVAVEVHWAISPGYLNCPPERSWLWERLQPATIAGQSAWTFPPEELLLVLCIHAANHCWTVLSWICDLAQIIHRNPDLNWDHLLDLAERWRASRMLLISLQLTQTLMDTELPLAVRCRLDREPQVKALAAQAYLSLFSPQYRYFKPFEEPVVHLRMRESWRERLHYCLEILKPSSKDWTLFSLPAALHFLYVLIRPVRLVFDHGVHLWRGDTVEQ
jgi:hypothetical protein